MDFRKELDTPCIVIDMDKVKNNIKTMQTKVEAYGCRLRPHIKTHKSVEIAKLQIAAGAEGITCAKVGEAEVMAAGGIKDIFIAYPLIGEKKIQRAIALHKMLNRLILAVDSLAGARALNEAGKSQGIIFEIRLEVDTGSQRTGAARGDIEDLGKEILQLENLKLTGIYTFKSLLYKNQPTLDAELAGAEEGRMMHQIALRLRDIGADIKDISAGSTPTGLTCAKTGLVNEVRPGTYVYYDQMTMQEGACTFNDIAAYIYATVVSVPTSAYGVVDGGTKTFPADVGLNVPPFYFHSYGYAVGREDLILDRLNEEHGILTSRTGDVGLTVGDILAFVPVHVCTSINLQNSVYLLENGNLRKIKIDARGALT